MTARLALLACLLGCAAAPDPGRAAAARAARWLWAQQAGDGGWHSRTYGILRSGQSLTPFVLDVLLRARDVCPAPDGAVARAVAFLRARTDASGGLGLHEEMLADYPNYATACGVMALTRAGEDASALVACLRRQQFGEDLGWTREHPAYGAWGMGGAPRRPPHPGQLDLSMTRFVVEALAAAGGAPEAFARTRVFLERCCNPDGGSLFSTVVEGANKAGERRSYGTTTADALLARVAMGEKPDGRWLIAHHRVDAVPGSRLPAKWSTAMLFYYRAAAARALRAVGHDGWQPALIDALVREQREDGSFVNDDFAMKEDDPLIATRFALEALLTSLRS